MELNNILLKTSKASPANLNNECQINNKQNWDFYDALLNVGLKLYFWTAPFL